MLKLTLKRVEGPWFTIGLLNLNGAFFCYTLEDKVQPPGVKVPGSTAIPYGSFDVELTYSPKFDQVVPQIMGVPGFTGVRLHWGNFLEDTEGCPLVGEELDYSDPVKGPTIKGGTSKPAYHRLFIALDQAKQAGERISIDIVKANPEEVPKP